MSAARTSISVSLALLGTAAVYAGSLLNMAAIGSTLGYMAIWPGVALIGIATLPVRALPPSVKRSVLVGVLRYLSMPVFLLSAVLLALAGQSLLSSTAGTVHGLYSGALLTAAGLLAITWPELLAIARRLHRASQP